MSSIPDWLSDEAIERTKALGREMAVFLQRQQAAAGTDVKIRPHPEPLGRLDAIKAESRGFDRE